MSITSTNGTRVEDMEVSIDASIMSQQIRPCASSEPPVFVPVERASKQQLRAQPNSAQDALNSHDADDEETACRGCPIC